MIKAKPFDIPKREVWEAWKHIRANHGAAGVDGESIQDFEAQLLATSTSSGTGCPREVIFHRLYAGWTSPRQMAGHARWVFQQLPTALRKRLSGDTLSHWWNQNSIRTHMGTVPVVRRSMRSESHVSVAGASTGFSISISRASSTTSTGSSCFVRCASTRIAGGCCSTSNVG
jgi:hypothetical protein